MSQSKTLSQLQVEARAKLIKTAIEKKGKHTTSVVKFKEAKAELVIAEKKRAESARSDYESSVKKFNEAKVKYDFECKKRDEAKVNYDNAADKNKETLKKVFDSENNKIKELKPNYDFECKKHNEAKVKYDNAGIVAKESATKAFDITVKAAEKAYDEYINAKNTASQFIKIEDATVSIEKPNEYIPKKEEVGFFHVELDQPNFDKKTGKKLSKAFVQLFDPKSFATFEKQASGLGYTIQVIWNPEAYLSL